MRKRGVQDNGCEPLFVDLFVNDDAFATALYEGGITGVAQDDNVEDNACEQLNRNSNSS